MLILSRKENESITIGDDIIVGAGSLVRKSITKAGVYSGNPVTMYKSLNNSKLAIGGVKIP